MTGDAADQVAAPQQASSRAAADAASRRPAPAAADFQHAAPLPPMPAHAARAGDGESSCARHCVRRLHRRRARNPDPDDDPFGGTGDFTPIT